MFNYKNFFGKRQVLNVVQNDNDLAKTADGKPIYTWYGELENGFKYRIKPLSISQIQKFYNYVVPCLNRIMITIIGDSMEFTPDATISDIPVIDIRTIFSASKKQKNELGGLDDYSLKDFFSCVQVCDLESIDATSFSLSEKWLPFGTRYRDLEDLGVINYDDINKIAEDVIRVSCMANDISLEDFKSQYRSFLKHIEQYRFHGGSEECFKYNLSSTDGKIETYHFKVSRLTNKDDEIDQFRERIFSYSQPGYVNVFALLDKENQDLLERFISKIQWKTDETEWKHLTIKELDEKFFGKTLMLIAVLEIAHDAMTSKKQVRELKKK
jgi:hypothetical protein